MTSVAELTKIVTGLLDGTKNGRLTWSPYENSAELTARTDRFTYYIKSRDDDDRAPYRFQIFHVSSQNEGSMLVEYVSDVGASPDLASKLAQLFDASKLNARGLGSSLSEEILKDLGDTPF